MIPTRWRFANITVHLYAVATSGQWLIAETFGEDGDLYKSIDMETAEPSAQIPYRDSLIFSIQAGLFDYRHHD